MSARRITVLRPHLLEGLRKIAGLELGGELDITYTALDILRMRRLIRLVALEAHQWEATPLGAAVARMRGWEPDERQRRLISELARGVEFRVSNRYRWDRPASAPRGTLGILETLRLIDLARPPELKLWIATPLCKEVARLLARDAAEAPEIPPVGAE